MNRTALSTAVIWGCCALAAAGCSTSGSGGSADGGSTPVTTGPAYTGPAIPGLEAAPTWTRPAQGQPLAAAAAGNAVVIAQRPPGGGPATLVTLDGATGRTLGNVALPEDPTTSISLRPDQDIEGHPVVIADYTASFPATGLQAATRGPAETVVDATGHQVWTSTPDSTADGEQAWYSGGYLIHGQFAEYTTGYLGETDPSQLFTQVSEVDTVTGGQVWNSGQQVLPDAYPIRHHTLITMISDIEDDPHLVAADLTRPGTTTWRGESGPAGGQSPLGPASTPETFLATVPDGLLTTQTTAGNTTYRYRDATGTIVHQFTGSPRNCELAVPNPRENSMICVGRGILKDQQGITDIDYGTGRIGWHQDSDREFSAGAAAGTTVYLTATDNPSQPVTIALDAHTGTLAADQIPLTPLAVTDSGGTTETALIWTNNTYYGFPTRP